MHKRITSAVKKLQFISGRIWCITQRGRSCDIVVLNVHVKDGFYEDVKRVLDKFPKLLMRILLENFRAKVLA